MSVADGAVVGSPVVHYGIYIFERSLVLIQARYKPGGRPGGVGAHVQHIENLGIYIGSPSFSNLEGIPENIEVIKVGDVPALCRSLFRNND